jgi:hypothetical protein
LKLRTATWRTPARSGDAAARLSRPRPANSSRSAPGAAPDARAREGEDYRERQRAAARTWKICLQSTWRNANSGQRGSQRAESAHRIGERDHGRGTFRRKPEHEGPIEAIRHTDTPRPIGRATDQRSKGAHWRAKPPPCEHQQRSVGAARPDRSGHAERDLHQPEGKK